MLIPLIVWVVILLFVFPVYLLAVIVFGFWRLVVNFIVWKWKPGFVAHFTSRDLAFTCDDFEGKVRKAIINVTVLKGRTDLETLREGIRARLLSNPFCFKMHCTPILYMGYWFWQKTEVHVSQTLPLTFPTRNKTQSALISLLRITDFVEEIRRAKVRR